MYSISTYYVYYMYNYVCAYACMLVLCACTLYVYVRMLMYLHISLVHIWSTMDLHHRDSTLSTTPFIHHVHCIFNYVRNMMILTISQTRQSGEILAYKLWKINENSLYQLILLNFGSWNINEMVTLTRSLEIDDFNQYFSLSTGVYVLVCFEK